MPSINEVRLMGHLGKDSEIRHTGSGKSVTNFSLATSRRWKDGDGEWKESTQWHNIVAWGLPDGIAQRLVKGALVLVQGRLETRNYESKDGRKVYVTEVIAEPGGVMYLRDAEQSGPPQRSGGNVRSMPRHPEQSPFPEDESVPF